VVVQTGNVHIDIAHKTLLSPSKTECTSRYSPNQIILSVAKFIKNTNNLAMKKYFMVNQMVLI